MDPMMISEADIKFPDIPFRKTAIVIAIGLALYLGFLYFTGFNNVLNVIRTTNYWLVGLAILVSLAGNLFHAAGWWTLLKGMDYRISLFKAYLIYLSSTFFVNLIPSAAISGEVAKIYFVQKSTPDTRFDRTMAAGLMSRILEIFPTAVGVIIGVIYLALFTHGIPWWALGFCFIVAEQQVREAMDLYSDFFTKLAVPFIINKRPDWDKFPGADYTMAFDTMMPDGKSLQVGTVHLLGTKFAKTFEITYEDDKGERQFVSQTCYGISERCIAATIGIHGDNKGLILPPNASPTQVVIIPIVFKTGGEEVLEACKKVKAILNVAGITAVLDDSNERPGAKYYRWEMKGVPFRIEIGPRDLKNNTVMLVRRDGVKESIPMDGLPTTVSGKLMDFQAELLKKAADFMTSHIKDCATLDEAKAQIDGGWARLYWCGEKACGLEMENATGGKLLGEPQSMKGSGVCPVCGKPADRVVLVSRSY